MNCKPGQLAVWWRNTLPAPCYDAAVGSIVKVEHQDSDVLENTFGGMLYVDGWTYFGRSIKCSCGNHIHVVPDADLKPLPPEDYVRVFDSLADIGAPHGVTT